MDSILYLLLAVIGVAFIGYYLLSEKISGVFAMCAAALATIVYKISPDAYWISALLGISAVLATYGGLTVKGYGSSPLPENLPGRPSRKRLSAFMYSVFFKERALLNRHFETWIVYVGAFLGVASVVFSLYGDYVIPSSFERGLVIVIAVVSCCLGAVIGAKFFLTVVKLFFQLFAPILTLERKERCAALCHAFVTKRAALKTKIGTFYATFYNLQFEGDDHVYAVSRSLYRLCEDHIGATFIYTRRSSFGGIVWLDNLLFPPRAGKIKHADKAIVFADEERSDGESFEPVFSRAKCSDINKFSPFARFIAKYFIILAFALFIFDVFGSMILAMIINDIAGEGNELVFEIGQTTFPAFFALILKSVVMYALIFALIVLGIFYRWKVSKN